MTNQKNEGSFAIDGKSFKHSDYSEIDPEFPCELTEPLYGQVDVKTKNPQALRIAVAATIQAVTQAEKENSSEKPHSIALRVAGQQKDVRVRLCIVFKS